MNWETHSNTAYLNMPMNGAGGFKIDKKTLEMVVRMPNPTSNHVEPLRTDYFAGIIMLSVAAVCIIYAKLV